jgi:LAGLIDADG endonuclease
MANLWLGQDAGSRYGDVDLGSYISGYIDGEGCFTVSISPRPTLLAGWEVRPSLSVSQNGDRAEVLLLIRQYFGCGSIRPDRSDRTVKWETRSLAPIRTAVIPHFRRYPLLSSKHADFESFAEICERMARGEHRLRAGLLEIVRLAGTMNPSGKRGYPTEMVIEALSR